MIQKVERFEEGEMDNERRKFKRFDAYMSVRYGYKAGSPTGGNLALSRDVSREGLCINSNDSIASGEVIHLEINLPDDPRPIRSTGRIVWTKKQAVDEGVNYGVKFESIDPVDKFRVLDYAYNHWLETKVNDFSDPEELTGI